MLRPLGWDKVTVRASVPGSFLFLSTGGRDHCAVPRLGGKSVCISLFVDKRYSTKARPCKDSLHFQSSVLLLFSGIAFLFQKEQFSL